MSYNPTSYDNWVYSQLEPNAKPAKLGGAPIQKGNTLASYVPPVALTEDEDNKRQDEYLKSKGIS